MLRVPVITVIAAPLIALALAQVPAHAGTAVSPIPPNPYTPAAACNNNFGGTWSEIEHAAVLTDFGDNYGDVYLMRDEAFANNCVVTIKNAYIGVVTRTTARARVAVSPDWAADDGRYTHYAAVQIPAAACVEYEGAVHNRGETLAARGGQSSC